MIGRMFYFFILFASTVSCFDDTDLNGFAYVQKTVENIDKSMRFYTEIFGGKRIEDFSVRNLQGDDHYYRMFQKEILDARNQRVSTQSLGVPDIRTGGQHVVNWEFILFDNTLIWLIQYTDRFGNVFRFSDTALGTAKNGYGHMAFWIEDDVNPYQMAQDIVDLEREIGLPYPGFISLDDFNSFQDRERYFQKNVDRFLFNSVYLTPNIIATTLGPDYERIELEQIRDINTYIDLCENKVIHPIMQGYKWNKNNRYEKPSIRTYGLHHFAPTVPNITQAIEFYTNVIGGKSPTQLPPFSNLPSDLKNTFFQDDLFLAQVFRRQADASFGYISTDPGSPNSINIAFINFVNFYLELYSFNVANAQEKRTLDRLWSSPAYFNNMHGGFWIKENVPMARYIKQVEERAASRGWNNVKANRAVDVSVLGQRISDNDYSRPLTTGGLEGFDYAYMKAPGGEQISFAKFTGNAAKVLKKEMLEYGALSSGFPETNPWNTGGFDKFCRDVGVEPKIQSGPPVPPGPPGPPESQGTTRPSVLTTRPPVETTKIFGSP